jgi:hypothetical protein
VGIYIYIYIYSNIYIMEMRNIIKNQERVIEEMMLDIRKKSVYNKERYEQNKEEILKYRRERYRTIYKKDLVINKRK